MSDILSLALPFFAVILCGYGAGWLRLIPVPGIAGVNSFVYWFALPALLFQVMAATPVGELADLPFLLAYALAGPGAFVIAAVAARLLLRRPLAELGVIGLGAGFGNIGYMGLPLIVTALGPAAATPLVLLLLLDNTLLLALAVALAELGRSRRRALIATLSRSLLAFARNPMILGALAGIAVSAFDLTVPTFLLGFTSLLGRAAGPAALFALGAGLAGRPIARGLDAAVLMVGCKLLLHPALMVLAAVLLLPVDPLWARAMVLAAALPIGGTVFVLAQEQGSDPGAVSSAVLISTGLSMVTLTILLSWLLLP